MILYRLPDGVKFNKNDIKVSEDGVFLNQDLTTHLAKISIDEIDVII